jgi:hypothetical protein
MSANKIRVTTIKVIDFDDGTMGIDFKYDPLLDISKLKQDALDGKPGRVATMGEMYAAAMVKMMLLEEALVTINMPSGSEVPVVREDGQVVCADPDVPPEFIAKERERSAGRHLESLEVPTDKSKLN